MLSSLLTILAFMDTLWTTLIVLYIAVTALIHTLKLHCPDGRATLLEHERLMDTSIKNHYENQMFHST